MTVDKLEDWHRTHYSRQITPELDGSNVTVFGWVEDLRDLGGIVFITVRDREGTLQVTVPKKSVRSNVLEKVSRVGKQFPIAVRGIVKAHKEAPAGVEVIPHDVKILGNVFYPLPLDPTGRVPADIDVRLDSRLLDLRRPECRALFKIRHEVVGEIRRFLAERGYLEVHTPKIIATATEGGAALFKVEYFDHPAFLAQSPELYKEELISVFEKVFEIGTVFRAEQSHTRRHVSEFVSIDLEEAFATAEDVMNTLEELVHGVVEHVARSCDRELETMNVRLSPIRPPCKIYTYTEVLEELRRAGVTMEWGEDVPTPAYRKLSELHQGEYYFIVDWPTKGKPFYIKPKEDNPELCHAFDFMYEWIELASGGSRVDSKQLLSDRLTEQGLDPKSFEFHLKTFEHGMPPHAGWAIGLERLLQAITARENIREVILFPRDRARLTP